MKNMMMKLAGAKTEEEFYEMFPTEEAFMAKYGKKLEGLKKGKPTTMGRGERQIIEPSQDIAYRKQAMSPDQFRQWYEDASGRATKSVSPLDFVGAAGLVPLLPGLATESVLPYVISAGMTSLGVPTNEKAKVRNDEKNELQWPGAMTPEGKETSKLKVKKFGWGGTQEGVPFQRFPFSEIDPTAIKGYDFGQAFDSTYTKPLINTIDTGMNTSIGGTKGAGKSGGGDAMAYVQAGADVIEGLSMIKGQKNAVKKAKQDSLLTGVQSLAASSRPEQIQRKYLRPEDMIQPAEAFTNTLGTGTEILAKKGKKIKKAKNGLDFEGTFGSDQGQQLVNSITNMTVNGGRGPDAGSKIGGGIGSAAGTAIGGPVGGAIGKFIGSNVGGFIDKADDKVAKYNNTTKRNIGNILFNTTSIGYDQFMEDGGKVAMGGDLMVGKGKATPTSFNPYIPGGGETVMFNGPGHEDGGMPISFGGSPVEVEGGEPATKINDDLVIFGDLPITKEYAAILGDPKAKDKKFKTYAKILSEEENKLNKIKAKAMISIGSDDSFEPNSVTTTSNKLMAEGADMKLQAIADKKMKASALQDAINNTAEEMGLVASDLAKGKVSIAKHGAVIPIAQDGETVPLSFDAWRAKNKIKTVDIVSRSQYEKYREKFNSELLQKEYIEKQNKLKQQRIRQAIQQDKNQSLLNYRQKVWLTWRNYLKPGDRRKLWSQETFEKNLYKNGIRSQWDNDDFVTFMDEYFPPKTKEPTSSVQDNKSKSEVTNEELAQIIPSTGATKSSITTGSKPSGKSSGSKRASIKYDPNAPIPPLDLNLPEEVEPNLDVPKTPADLAPYVHVDPIDLDLQYYREPEKPDNVKMAMMAINSVLPYLRPSDTEELDPRQIMGELHALSNSQVDPVQAQLYHPQLMTPQDISLQDMLNENRAGYRATERLVGGNPAALSVLNAQRYQADQRVLSEQFRQNQAEKNRVYSGNVEAMNQAQMQNLQILDNQMVRQETAKSNTKETIQNALNSISSKYLQNQLENRKLATYENMYNYRYGDDFRADNYNPLQFFNTESGAMEPIEFASNRQPVYVKENGEDKVVGTQRVPKKKTLNGGIVKAIKNL